MNILHLKYAVEVERTRSITKAASNLYMGQPNLSRAIKELVQNIGITLFKRTANGIVPTAAGEDFLFQAKNVLKQIERLENQYKPANQNKIIFNISVPRSNYIAHAFSKFVSGLDTQKELEISYKETNSMRTINNLLQGNYNLGIIRYHNIYDSQFLNFFKEKNLKCEPIWQFKYKILISEKSKLASLEKLTVADLETGVEIAFGDPYVPSLTTSEVRRTEYTSISKRRICIFERASQFDLLKEIPDSYIWVSSLPDELLKMHGLTLKSCIDNEPKQYKDVLVYRQNYSLTDIDKEFIKYLKKTIGEISEE